jgi:hypothetical protein
VEANLPARMKNSACRVEAGAERRFAGCRGFPSLARRVTVSTTSAQLQNWRVGFLTIVKFTLSLRI